jgi:hypothetical protein
VRAALLDRPIDTVIAEGLHDFLDALQRDLILLAAEIGTSFFRDWRPLLVDKPEEATQMQTQGIG